jgi:hypothetical protein
MNSRLLPDGSGLHLMASHGPAELGFWETWWFRWNVMMVRAGRT